MGLPRKSELDEVRAKASTAADQPMYWIGITMSERETVFHYKCEKCAYTCTKAFS